MATAMPTADVGEPFFDQLLADTLTPARVEVGDLQITVDIPVGAQVADLDDAATPSEVLEVLLAPPVGEGDEPDPDDEAALDELLDDFEARPARELTTLADRLLEHFALAVAPPTGWAHLVELLDRYGPGIEYDLLELGSLRLPDFLLDPRRHPWSLLLRLLAYFPQGGGYWAAQQDDEQLAREQLEAEEAAKARGEKRGGGSKYPPLFGWTRAAERETALIDAIRQNVHATWGASSKFKGKGGKPPATLPRPRNAMVRARWARSMEEHDEIVGMLLPRGVEPPPDDALEYATPAVHDERIPSRDAVRGAVLLDP